jgi:uroporphyrinogen-III decarboxylase
MTMDPGRNSSRRRMLAALHCENSDSVPCCFMLYNALKEECHNYAEFIQRQVQMGLDAYVEVPMRPASVVNDYYNLHGLPVSYDERVEIHEWVERFAGEVCPILVKEYHTPAGILRSEVRQTEDWRWGEHTPFLDDYIVPRARKFIVKSPRDLDGLHYLLCPPKADEIEAFHGNAEEAFALARKYDLMTAGGWGVGADLIGWIFGLENMIYAVNDEPQFIAEMLEIIAAWNHARMRVILESGVDLYIKRAWYENCDFWSPKTWKTFIAPILKADAALAHAYGVKFGYIITAAAIPLLDEIAEVGVDVIIGVDPQRWDVAETARRLAGRVCVWGGVNGHQTVEQGDENQVCSETLKAMQLFSNDGFILSPVDNVRNHTPAARRNVQALIQTWQDFEKERRLT